VQAVLEHEVAEWLRERARPELAGVLSCLLQLDAWIRPRYGEIAEFDMDADFDLQGVCDALEAMRLPDPACFDGPPRRLRMRSPGGLGVVLRSPDGGHWLQARPLAPEEQFTPDAPGSAGAGSPSVINLSSS
jgi:hypothetical protein